MDINRLTLTGIDDNSKIVDVKESFKNCEILEHGILFSKAKEGLQRYPSAKWLTNLINSFETETDFKFSAHLCGEYSRNVLEKSNFEIFKKFGNFFKRFQLNYSFGRNFVNLDKFFDYVDGKDFDIILQYNRNNSNFLETYINQELPKNVNILFDSSGGRGTVIQNIQNPFNCYTGYSGGINVENVEEICQKILKHSNTSNVWIDLESGVRTDNNFDFVKANKIINSVNKITNLKQNNEIF